MESMILEALRHIFLICFYVLLRKEGELEKLLAEKIDVILSDEFEIVRKKEYLYRAVVTANSILVQTGPGREYPDLEVMRYGEMVEVYEERRERLYARIHKIEERWLNMAYLQRIGD